MQEEPVYGYSFDGKRYDCGSKLGYLEANVELALEHPELAAQFEDYLDRFMDQRRRKVS
jgi:UTP--glucose-1-phosphate uridylyltransferase